MGLIYSCSKSTTVYANQAGHIRSGSLGVLLWSPAKPHRRQQKQILIRSRNGEDGEQEKPKQTQLSETFWGSRLYARQVWTHLLMRLWFFYLCNFLQGRRMPSEQHKWDMCHYPAKENTWNNSECVHYRRLLNRKDMLEWKKGTKV